MKKKVMFIFGTRPEAIKVVPVVEAFKKDGTFETVVISTGQHREMLEQVLGFFGVEPDEDLSLMKPNQNLASLMSRAIDGVNEAILRHRPDFVVVQGDTTTACAAGMAGFLNGCKVCHIEAGLRSWDLQSPFPEEANRVLIGKVADFHFAPTDMAVSNLKKENVTENLYNVGNTVIDALLLGLKIIGERGEDDYLKRFSELDFSRDLVMVTIHRRESFGEPLLRICAALRQIAAKYPTVQFVYPVHPNPNIKDVVEEELAGVENLNLIKPLDYPDFIWMMSKSRLIITDSGGVQEEAPSAGVPVIVAREVTERSEGVDAGVAHMAGSDPGKLMSLADRFLSGEREKDLRQMNPYGDGTTSLQILDILKNL